MKPQDILFFVILFALIVIKRGKFLHIAGSIAFLFAGILFLINNLFTSQRLSWYGLGFMAAYLVRQVIILIHSEGLLDRDK